MTCGTCKYWQSLEWFRDQDGVEVRSCSHPMVIKPTYGANGDRTGNLTMRADGVLTADEGGCTDRLMTGPDFGCVHWRATE